MDDKIDALSKALEEAQAAFKSAGEADKSELEAMIDQSYASMDAAIKAVQANLDNTKNELQAAINALEADQQKLAEQLAKAEAEAEQTEQKTTTTQIVSTVTVGAVNLGLLAGAFFFLRRKRLF